MDVQSTVVENKGKIKMNEVRIEALITLLSKEGIITDEEVKKKVDEILGQLGDEQ